MIITDLREVIDYMAKAIDGGHLAAASPIVDQVQRELEDGYLGRRLEIEDHTEDVPLYPDDNFIELTYTPLRSVSALAIDGTAQQANTWVLERSGVQLFRGFPGYSLMGFAYPQVVSVTYSAGLGEPALSVGRGVILARSARIIDKMLNDERGLESIKVEGYLAKWLAEDDFTDGEKNQMQRWKRRGFSNPPGMPYPMTRPYFDPFTRY